MKATLENDFVHFARTGDPLALARVFDALAPRLLLVADHVARGTGEAEDLVQTTFLAALRDAASYDRSRPLLHWMTGILVHRAQDARRRAQVRVAGALESAPEPSAPDDPGALAETHEVAERVSVAIEALSDPYREVLVLRAVHGLEPTEIAHALGRAPGTVRMQLKRAREKLREVLPRELALPALFVADEGPGLAGVRSAVLAEGTRASATLATASAWGGAKALVGAAVVVLAVAGFALGPWRDPGTEFAVSAGLGSRAAAPSDAREPRGTRALAAPGQDDSPGRQAIVPEGPSGSRATSDRSAPDDSEHVVVGRVVTQEGRPAPGATVFALDRARPDLMRTLARTDEEGRFRIEGVELDVQVGASLEGLQPTGFGKKSRASLRWLADGSRMSEPVLLVLGPQGQALAGRVVDAHGRGVPRARVLLAVDEDARESGGQPHDRRLKSVDREGFVVLADEAGHFVTHAAPAGRTLLVARGGEDVEGVAFGLVDVERGIQNRTELVLQTGARVFGRVSDRAGRGVAGLELSTEWKGSDALGELEDELAPLLVDRRARTDENGRFVLAGLVPGEHEVELSSGPRSLARRRLELEAGESASFDLDIDPVVDVTVRVLDPAGEALAGWGLSWSLGDEGRDWVLARERELPPRTDREGRCRLEGLEPGALTFAVTRPPGPGEDGRRAPARLPCALRPHVVAGSEEIALRLSSEELAEGRLGGRWLDAAGRPLAGADLWLGRLGWNGELRPRTDGDGNFAITGLAPGDYELRSEHDRRYPGRALLARVVLAPGEERDLGTLSLPDSPRLEVVLDLEHPGRFEASRPELRCAHGAPCGGRFEGPRETSRFLTGPLDAGRHRFGLWSPEFAPVLGEVEVAPTGTTTVQRAAARGQEVLFEVEITDPVSLDRLAAGRGREAPPAQLMWSLRDESGARLATLKTGSPFDRASRRLVVPLRFLPGLHVIRLLDDNGSRERAEVEVRFELARGGRSETVRVSFPR